MHGPSESLLSHLGECPYVSPDLYYTQNQVIGWYETNKKWFSHNPQHNIYIIYTYKTVNCNICYTPLLLYNFVGTKTFFFWYIHVITPNVSMDYMQIIKNLHWNNSSFNTTYLVAWNFLQQSCETWNQLSLSSCFFLLVSNYSVLKNSFLHTKLWHRVIFI